MLHSQNVLSHSNKCSSASHSVFNLSNVARERKSSHAHVALPTMFTTRRSTTALHSVSYLSSPAVTLGSFTNATPVAGSTSTNHPISHRPPSCSMSFPFSRFFLSIFVHYLFYIGSWRYTTILLSGSWCTNFCWISGPGAILLFYIES
ncbi:hypothetical protein BC943DRAFT_32095 [Umbelopsis sp. AD052]|nr:hypothetical protein BC943DRAFT_32095 [Umbelopsis sp. AD052]